MSSLAIEAGSRRCVKAAAPSAAAVRSSLTAASTAPVRGSTRTIDPRCSPSASRATRLRPRSIESRTASPSGSAGSRSGMPVRSGAASGSTSIAPSAADGRDQGAVPVEEELAGAGIPRRQPADEPRPEAARCERHGARRGARAGFGLVAPLEREGRRVQVSPAGGRRDARGRRACRRRRGGLPRWPRGRAPRARGLRHRGGKRPRRSRAPPAPRRRLVPRGLRSRRPASARARANAASGGRGVAGQEPLPPEREIGGGRSASQAVRPEAPARATRPHAASRRRSRAALQRSRRLRPSSARRRAGRPAPPGRSGSRGRGSAPRPRGPAS